MPFQSPATFGSDEDDGTLDGNARSFDFVKLMEADKIIQGDSLAVLKTLKWTMFHKDYEYTLQTSTPGVLKGCAMDLTR